MTYARHNLSALGDGSNTLDFFTGVFTLSNGILGLVLLGVVFFIAFSILQARNNTKDSLAGSLFLTTTLSIIMVSMGILLPMYALGLAILLAFLALSYLFGK